MKKLLLFIFSLFYLFTFSALAIDDDAEIDWGAPIVEAGRTGCVYPIKYTKTDPTANNGWMQRNFDDSSWTDGFGPIANTGFGGVLGTTFDDVNDGEYNVWFRRSFTLEESFNDKDVWLACGHDDEGAIYIDGVKVPDGRGICQAPRLFTEQDSGDAPPVRSLGIADHHVYHTGGRLLGFRHPSQGRGSRRMDGPRHHHLRTLQHGQGCKGRYPADAGQRRRDRH